MWESEVLRMTLQWKSTGQGKPVDKTWENSSRNCFSWFCMLFALNQFSLVAITFVRLHFPGVLNLRPQELLCLRFGKQKWSSGHSLNAGRSMWEHQWLFWLTNVVTYLQVFLVSMCAAAVLASTPLPAGSCFCMTPGWGAWVAPWFRVPVSTIGHLHCASWSLGSNERPVWVQFILGGFQLIFGYFSFPCSPLLHIHLSFLLTSVSVQKQQLHTDGLTSSHNCINWVCYHKYLIICHV